MVHVHVVPNIEDEELAGEVEVEFVDVGDDVLERHSCPASLGPEEFGEVASVDLASVVDGADVKEARAVDGLLVNAF